MAAIERALTTEIVFLVLVAATECLLGGPLALIGGLRREAAEFEPLFIISDDRRMKKAFRSLSAV